MGLVHADAAGTREWRLDIGRDSAGDFSIATSPEPTTPFSIRRSTGTVGIGTTTPRDDAKLDVAGHARAGSLTVDDFINSNGAVSAWGLGGQGWLGLVHADATNREWRLDIGRDSADDFTIATSPEGTTPFSIQRSTGHVGIGISSPSHRLHVVGDIFATGMITQGSSRTLKENIVPLAAQEALNALEGLAPVTYRYKHDDAGDLQVGFVAEDVPELAPRAVGAGTRGLDRDFRFACPGWPLYTPEGRRAHETLFIAQSSSSRGRHLSPR